MRKKKDLPLTILKALEPFVKLKGNKFEVVDPKESFLKVIDRDKDSDFYFSIEKYRRIENGTFQLFLNRKPKDRNVHNSYESWIEVSGLQGQFDFWLKLLEEYETVNSFFDDPITKGFEEQFYSEFELMDDEEAETNPLRSRQILLLDEYLENTNNKLSELETEENRSDLKDIRVDIEELRNGLTTNSKKWVIKKLARVWARIAKQGAKFIKAFISESSKELIKQGVKGVIEIAKEKGNEFLT